MASINVIVFLLFNFINQYFLAESAPEASFQVDYDKKVCNNELTCNLTTNPNLSPEKLIFPWRDCMCDFECSEYNDCCTDSQYYKAPKLNNPPKTYFCSPESKVYMVTSCLPDFTDERIKGNCAKALQPLEENNFALILPVTNTAKRTTYANAYCALCNNDEDFVPWLYASGCGEPPKGYLEQKAAAIKKESPKNKPTDANTPSKPNNNRLNINIHLNPGAMMGKNDVNDGFNKELSIPMYSNLGTKAANKSVGSQSGFFGAKTGPIKREVNSSKSAPTFNFYPYAKKINELMKIVKYDDSVKEFIAHYENKTLVCKLSSKMPDSLNKIVRKCVPNLISKCPNDWDGSNRCPTYVRLVHDLSEDKSYLNIHCAKCNGVDVNAVKLMGCYPGKRVGASSLFSNDGKGNANNAVCNDPKLASKLC